MKKQFDVIGKSKIWFIIPAILIIAGIIVTLVLGLNIGIDFEGGTIVNVTFSDDLTDAEYTTELNKVVGIIENNGLKVAQKQKAYDEGTVISVRYENKGTEDEMISLNDTVKTALIEAYRVEYDNGDVGITTETISSTASKELLLRATIAIVAAAVVMLIYIGFRFDWKSGLAAIIALIVNVLIMVALTAVFQIQINTSFIAAIITIIAYSINATIVIFDRVREYKKKAVHLEKVTKKDIANDAIRSSFTRTVYATFTTLVTISVLATIALPSIREFSLPIIFGLIAGSYSSICVAPALWVKFSGGKFNEKVKEVPATDAK